jgi:hypothetical protein
MEREREELQGRIKTLQMVYLVVFLGSCGAALVNFVVLPAPVGALHIAFWIGLATSVGIRIYRSSLVNRYNALVMGKDGPMT